MIAVPLLVFGLGIPAREAVGISLAAVGATALAGFLHRWKLGQVDIRTGLLFAGAGMLGAPLGTWIASWIPETLLMLMFSLVMVVVAVRLWRRAPPPAETVDSREQSSDATGSLCHRGPGDNLILSSRCAMSLAVVGVFTGIFSGMFGVGGGIVIIPALVLFSRMPMQRAIGSSLMIIALVSAAGVASFLLAGRAISPGITLFFVAGGMAGLFAGQRIGSRLSAVALQRVFASAMLAMASWIAYRNLYV
jgi:uncharacterized membrane protein YfcA